MIKNPYVLYIPTLDVEPAAMLREENKQYTVKRSEPRCNRDIWIYSLIRFLLHEPHATFNDHISFLSRSPLSIFFFFVRLQNLYFSLLSLTAEAHPISYNPADALIGFELYRHPDTGMLSQQKESVSNII